MKDWMVGSMLSPHIQNVENYNFWHSAGRTLYIGAWIAAVPASLGAALVVYDHQFDGDPAFGDLAWTGGALEIAAFMCLMPGLMSLFRYWSKPAKVRYEDED